MTPQDVADRYFTAMRTGSVAGLTILFAQEGAICWPDGTLLDGKDAIKAGYERLFANATTNPSSGRLMIADDRYFSVQVTTLLADGSARRTINVFQLNADGLIERLDSYRQG